MTKRKGMFPGGRELLLFCLSCVIVAGCGSAKPPPQPQESRGRVLDQDTGQPIPGAIVVGKYQGGLRWGGGSCNRIESAVADQNGEFALPLDPNAGLLYMEAYHRDYVYGHHARYAVGLAPDKWQIWVEKWDETNMISTVVAKEPKIYRTEGEAKEASREDKDIHLRRFTGSRQERLRELDRLVGMGICGGRTLTTDGAIEFLKAIYQEQTELFANSDSLRDTQSALRGRQDDIVRWKGQAK
jgi:hypothetical protein